MKSPIRAAATFTPSTAILKMAAVFALATTTLFAPQPARANRLGADVIALFPKEVGEFAYADLKKARTMPWFPQLQQQMLPDRFKQFEKFLATAGVDPIRKWKNSRGTCRRRRDEQDGDRRIFCDSDR